MGALEGPCGVARHRRARRHACPSSIRSAGVLTGRSPGWPRWPVTSRTCCRASHARRRHELHPVAARGAAPGSASTSRSWPARPRARARPAGASTSTSPTAMTRTRWSSATVRRSRHELQELRQDSRGIAVRYLDITRCGSPHGVIQRYAGSPEMHSRGARNWLEGSAHRSRRSSDPRPSSLGWVDRAPAGPDRTSGTPASPTANRPKHGCHRPKPTGHQ